MNQTFYFQHVCLGSDDSGTLLDAILERCQVMNRPVSFRVLQEAQILLRLLVFQKIDSEISEAEVQTISFRPLTQQTGDNKPLISICIQPTELNSIC